MSEEDLKKGRQTLEELTKLIQNLSDQEISKLFDKESIHLFLTSIVDPKKAKEYPDLGEFFLQNKNKTQIIAILRFLINQMYSYKVSKDGKQAYITPNHVQWYPDGVMFFEGKIPWAGFIGLYQNKELKYAIAARSFKEGDEIGQDGLKFVNVDDFNKGLSELHKKKTDVDQPLKELKSMLDKKEDDETHYQQFFSQYPWILGLLYEKIENHQKLDDENIPDFTGVRVHDKNRDIFEIKPPYLPLFKENNEFNANFNDAWNQTERYLNFARENKDYLTRKGLNFDNPECYLIIGYQLDDAKLKAIRSKGRVNPSIKIMTYNDLIVFIENTIGFIRQGPTAKSL